MKREIDLQDSKGRTVGIATLKCIEAPEGSVRVAVTGHATIRGQVYAIRGNVILAEPGAAPYCYMQRWNYLPNDRMQVGRGEGYSYRDDAPDGARKALWAMIQTALDTWLDSGQAAMDDADTRAEWARDAVQQRQAALDMAQRELSHARDVMRRAEQHAANAHAPGVGVCVVPATAESLEAWRRSQR